MRSLATSDQPAARAISAAIGAVSTTAHARDFIRILHRMGADPSAIVPHVKDSPNFRNRRFAASDPALRPRFRAETSALIAARCCASIGADLGPFDLTLLPVGAYDPFWPDIHLDPEQAVAAHRDVNRIGADATGAAADAAGVADDVIPGDERIETPGGAHRADEPDPATTTVGTQARTSVPVHRGTFNLAMHWWAECSAPEDSDAEGSR